MLGEEGGSVRPIILKASRHRYVPFAAIISLAVIQVIGHWGSIQFGDGVTIVDARNVWEPLAADILQGEPLYSQSNWDNKPPIFQFINLAVHATGHYYIVFYLLIGVANGIAASLLYKWVVGRSSIAIAIISTVLFLGFTPLLRGVAIGPRSFAIVAVLAAFILKTPIKSGVLFGLAGLCTQFTAFIALPFLYFRMKESWEVPQAFKFIGAGVLVVAASFAAVAIIWSPTTMWYGVRYSLFAAPGYVEEFTSKQAQILGNASILVELYHLLIPAAVGAVFAWRDRLIRTAAIVAIAVLLSLAIRQSRTYIFFGLPFLSILAAFGFREIITRFQRD